MNKLANLMCLLATFTVSASVTPQDIFPPNDLLKHPKADLLSESFTNQNLNRSVLLTLPFQGDAQEYYGLLSGTVVQNYHGTEYLHVRGSRHDEGAYSFERVHWAQFDPIHTGGTFRNPFGRCSSCQ